MAEMICKSCGNINPSGSKFCNQCGSNSLIKAKAKNKKNDVKVPTPKQLNDGTWFIQLRKENQYIKASTSAECIAKAIAVRTGVIEQQARIKDSLGSIIDTYIDACEKQMYDAEKAKNRNTKSITTIKAYKSYRKHRFQAIMDKKIHQIEWQTAIDDECSEVSAKTVLNAWRLITASIKYYNRNHQSMKITIPDVELPTKDTKEHAFLDYEQIKILVQACYNTPYELPILLGLHGLRRSEIMALTADDINPTTKKIRVNKALRVDSDNNHIISIGNKTKLSTRLVDIHFDRIIELSKEKQGLLFEGNINEIYRHVNTICRQNNLPEIGVHGLRHSFASLCYHLKLDIKYVMLQGGWSSPDVPQRIYIHLSEADNLKDSKKLRKFFDTVSIPTNDALISKTC